MSSDILNEILSGLNERQRLAVTSSPKGQVQVVAGPGTGKTKVLTSRVAYLILHHNISPKDIIVTTFTKKAANEMTDRLYHLLKDTDIRVSELMIGTFHSICNSILRRFGRLIGIKGFKIASERDTETIMKRLTKELTKELEPFLYAPRLGEKVIKFTNNDKVTFQTSLVSHHISKLKAAGQFVEDYARDPTCNRCLLRFYEEYQKQLNEKNYLDFDDMMLFTGRLLQRHKCLKSLKHLLVDEFQDTNNIQLQLIGLLGQQNLLEEKNITIVGDPDQSIYSFRSAVSDNFERFKNGYPGSKIIQLDKNYRSTQEVLDLSEKLMQQQAGRTKRKLLSHAEENFKPVYLLGKNGDSEADQIAQEIKSLAALPKLFKYSDFVILLRANYLMKTFEKSLIKHRIPYTVVKGRQFWKRKEIELILDFLRLLAYDDDILAISRVISESVSGVGEKTLDVITSFLEEKLKEGILPLDALIGVICGEYVSKLSQNVISNLKDFLDNVDRIYSLYNRNIHSKENILEVFDAIMKLDVFKDRDPGAISNIEEFKRVITDFVPEDEELIYAYSDDEHEEDGISTSKEEADFQTDDSISEGKVNTDVNEIKNQYDIEIKKTEGESFLDIFIRSVDLYIDSDLSFKDESRGRVSICTIHAAKGLEWPVVFVPCLIEGVLPILKVLDEEVYNEERRVLYVATTRTKHLLYLSYAPREFQNSASSFLVPEVINATSPYQTAFENIKSIKTLYECYGVKPPSEIELRIFLNYYSELLEYRREYRAPTERHTIEDQEEEVTYKPLPKPPKFAPRYPAGSSDPNAVKRRKTLGVRRRLAPQ